MREIFDIFLSQNSLTTQEERRIYKNIKPINSMKYVVSYTIMGAGRLVADTENLGRAMSRPACSLS